MNRNNRGITLDLTRPQCLALAKRLLAEADVVVNNNSVDVMPKLGLGYDVLSKLDPRLIMVSMSAFGADSLHRTCRTYGSDPQARLMVTGGSGIPTGYPS